jgi:hypothetical protein
MINGLAILLQPGYKKISSHHQSNIHEQQTTHLIRLHLPFQFDLAGAQRLQHGHWQRDRILHGREFVARHLALLEDRNAWTFVVGTNRRVIQQIYMCA